MKHCSWWVIAGFALLVSAFLWWGGGEWYVNSYLPDTPERVDGKRFIHTPRGDASLSVLLGAVFILVLGSITSLIGVLRGPRTTGCLIAGLLGPMLLCLPFVGATPAGIAALCGIAVVSSALWHRLLPWHPGAMLGATITTTAAFRVVLYLQRKDDQLPFLSGDQFLSMNVVSTLVFAFIVALLIGRFSRARPASSPQ